MSIEKKELDRIYSLLDNVKDPEIGISIVKLRMIDSVEKRGDALNISIKLTVPGCPLSATIESDIKKALAGENYGDINIDFDYMTKEELESVKKAIYGNNQKLPTPIERYDKKSISNIIAVYSAKGGVGKSSVVALLALVANRLGYRTGILDCDISGPSIQTILRTNYRAAASEKGKIAPLDYKGVKIISVDMLTNAEALIWRGPLVSSAIKQMYSDTDWGSLDVLFLDLPPGTSDGPLTVFQSIPVDKIVLVTTPQILSQTVGAKTMLMAETLKVPLIGIIENMSYMVCDHCGGRIDLAGEPSRRISKIPILAKLPLKQGLSSNLEGTLSKESFTELNGVINAIAYKP